MMNVEKNDLNSQTPHFVNRYFELSGERDMFAIRAMQYTAWTIPGIMPRKDVNYVEREIQHDFQSTGARGLINLANKIGLVLFHPSKPFLKLKVPPEEMKALGTMNKADIDTVLSKIETEVMERFNSGNMRGKMIEVLQLLIAVGDCVLKFTDNGLIVYNINEYVRELSYDGSLNILIIKEKKLPRNFPDAIKKKLKDKGHECKEDDTVPLVIYTHVERIGNTDRYKVYQSMEEIGKLTEKDGVYNKDDLPYISVFWQRFGRDNYGRGHVEALAGDFSQLSNVAESIAELVTVLANIIFLVKPSCSTSITDLESAESGDYVPGEPDDITCFSADVKLQIDSLVAQQERLERKLGASFLLTSAVTRDAERVTAEEIRMQAAELESTLGGVYTNLSFLLQYPLAKRLLNALNPSYKRIHITILTGLEALSRFSDLENWKRLLTDLANAAAIPPQAAAWIKYDELIKVLAAGYGLDYTTVLKTLEEYTRDQQQAMSQEQEHQAALEQNKAAAQNTEPKQ